MSSIEKTSNASEIDPTERLRRAEMLLDISRQVSGLESLDEILDLLVKITTTEIGAERGTLFLNDPTTGELYSRIAQGVYTREIRILNNAGIAGHVFTENKSEFVENAYSDPRFNSEIDERTDFVTKSILCAPLRTVRGEVLGVTQILNKLEGSFTEEDMLMLELITTQASIAIQSNQIVEQMKRNTVNEMEFLDMIADVTSEIDIVELLNKVMHEAKRMLNAERSSVFLNDEKTDQLNLLVGEGLPPGGISFPNHAGIAGAVFTTGETINIPHAYADLRFNPASDKQNNFFTSSMLCIPVVNKSGKKIGVTQVLNKRGGPFTEEDEQRLTAFTAQVSIALENAKLFSEVQTMQNYNESILQSMPNGMITFDETQKIKTCNQQALDLLEVSEASILGQTLEDTFSADNAWLMEEVNAAEGTLEMQQMLDAEIKVGSGVVSVNSSALPLLNEDKQKIGSLLMLEDISSEKRMKSMMSRYMDAGLADRLMDGDEDTLGGSSTEATVLFSDIRGFTPLTESLGAQGTVALLNEYFTLMVECLQDEGGMLDKFIGDAIMAGFGLPVTNGDDEDRAVRCSIAMIKELWKWNDTRRNNGQDRVDIGIGLNTDSVVSGNIGSLKRMDYTMIGDGVNLAARLESACKQYRARILISDNTYSKLRGTYRAREIDTVVVKGKSEPVKIHEILDYHTDESFPNIQDVLNFFKSGREEYQKQNWDKAKEDFQLALGLNQYDHLSKIYMERCDFMKANPPGDDWNGVWTMDSK